MNPMKRFTEPLIGIAEWPEMMQQFEGNRTFLAQHAEDFANKSSSGVRSGNWNWLY
jgi:hypothetical protein